MLRLAEGILFQNRRFHEELQRDTLDALRHIQRLSDQLSCEAIILVFPYLKPLTSYTARERSNYVRLLAFLDQEGIEYIDMRPVFERVDMNQLRGSPHDGLTDGQEDFWHPNRVGHELIGEALFERLVIRLSNLPPRRYHAVVVDRAP